MVPSSLPSHRAGGLTNDFENVDMDRPQGSGYGPVGLFRPEKRLHTSSLVEHYCQLTPSGPHGWSMT